MSNKYDVIIIGAGIGGLVCGCYLAKAGLKVLIIEKNANPGGYCNSFEVKGYKFDGFVHSLGNLTKESEFYQILDEIGVVDKLDLIRYNPSDILTTADFKIHFWNDVNKTIEDISKIFPKEKPSISNFFKDISNKKFLDSVVQFRNKTFQNILDEYFTDEKLKSVLSFPIYAHVGGPSKFINAFSGIKHYYHFMVNGGYYPKKGIQVLSNALADQFRRFGGELVYSNKVKKILTKSNKGYEVICKNDQNYTAQYIISDSDAKQTFLELIDQNLLPNSFINKLKTLKPSLSLFVLYLGLKESFQNVLDDGVDYAYILDYNFDSEHGNDFNYECGFEHIKWFLIRFNHSSNSAQVFVTAPYKNADFWDQNRKNFIEKIIEAVDEYLPSFSDNIVFKTCTTPVAFNNWTLNSSGAAYGWASTVDQFMDLDFARDDIVKNLFLCGHWTTLASGVPGVSYVGKRVAKTVLNNLKFDSKL